MTKSERVSPVKETESNLLAPASDKQISFVKTICEESFIRTGWREKPEALDYVMEWVGSNRKIASFGDLSKREATRIINDKMSSSGGVTSLEKYLQSKHPADRDPWETPKD
jgi:hypothetical protein